MLAVQLVSLPHPTHLLTHLLTYLRTYSVLTLQVTVETIVRALMVDMHKNSGETNVAVMRKQETELVALCKKKMGESSANGEVQRLLHREAFEDNYKNIFGEALAYKIRHDAMKKKRFSMMGTLPVN